MTSRAQTVARISEQQERRAQCEKRYIVRGHVCRCARRRGHVEPCACEHVRAGSGAS